MGPYWWPLLIFYQWSSLVDTVEHICFGDSAKEAAGNVQVVAAEKKLLVSLRSL